ncbi:MAG: hypothetical protein E7310_00855 [Clostridiales bacterium]|nr:hypothetical protein [Clostridiales bacterium]
MEFLQTIWTALTTENEVMTKIICSPFTFIEVYISMLLFTTILNFKGSRSQNILYVLTFSLSSLISIHIIPTPYNTFINLIICPILVLVIFKTNILKAFLSEIITYLIFILIGIPIHNLLIIFYNISTNIINTIPIYKIFSSCIIYSVALILYITCLKFNINITLLDKFKRKTNSVILLNIFLGILSISIQSYIATLYIEVLPLRFNIVKPNNITLVFFN